MYNSVKSISQKVKFKLDPLNTGTGTKSDYKFLFLQVPFKLIIGTEVFVIIKVYRNYVCSSGSETNHLWAPSIQNPKQSQDHLKNIYKVYEGYTMVSISDAYW